VIHQIAYQLIVTHRGAGPDPGYSPDEWEFGNPRFNGQNAAKNALSPLTWVSQRYGWAKGLSTAAGAADLKLLQRLPRVRPKSFKSISGTRNH